MPNRFTAPAHLGAPAAKPAPADQADRRLFIDRRSSPRRRVEAVIEGRRVDHSLDAHQHPRVTLTLQDLSLGGLSAVSDLPLGAGERVTVFFPPQDQPTMRLTTSAPNDVTPGGWDAYGHVVRCTPSGHGYNVAIAFDTLPAA